MSSLMAGRWGLGHLGKSASNNRDVALLAAIRRRNGGSTQNEFKHEQNWSPEQDKKLATKLRSVALPRSITGRRLHISLPNSLNMPPAKPTSCFCLASRDERRSCRPIRVFLFSPGYQTLALRIRKRRSVGKNLFGTKDGEFGTNPAGFEYFSKNKLNIAR